MAWSLLKNVLNNLIDYNVTPEGVRAASRAQVMMWAELATFCQALFFYH